MFILIYLNDARTYEKLQRIYFFQSFSRGNDTDCDNYTNFSLSDIQLFKKKMINFRFVKKQIIKYKREILFSVAMAMICFSIALWAIGVNFIKYHNIIGSY